MAEIKIPGKEEYEWREVIYIEVPPDKKFEEELFHEITTQHKPIIPQEGGVISENFIIIIPDGTTYFGLSYNKDIEGWRQQILYGTSLLKLDIGIIKDGKTFVTSGEKSISLTDCTFERYNFYNQDRQLVKNRVPIDKEKLF